MFIYNNFKLVISFFPDFFNWNKVKIRYCDGASLSGNKGSDVQVASRDNIFEIQFVIPILLV